VPKACKNRALRGFNRLPPLRDKSARYSLKKRQVLQKSAPQKGGTCTTFFVIKIS